MSNTTDMALPQLEQAMPGPAPEDAEDHTAAELAPVFDVPVNIQAVLGRAHMDVASLLRLTKGSVLELDRKVGEAIDIFANSIRVSGSGCSAATARAKQVCLK